MRFLSRFLSSLGVAALLAAALAHPATARDLEELRARAQELADEVSAQVERARRGQPNGYQGSPQGPQYPAAPRASSGQVIEPWSPR